MKRLIIVLSVSSIMALSLTIVIFWCHLRNSKEQTSKCNLEKFELESEIEQIYYLDSLRAVSLSKRLCDYSAIVKDTNGFQFALSSLIRTNTLIVRFSENDCSSCLKEELDEFSLRIATIKFPVLLLGTVRYHPEIAHYINKKYNAYPVYYINDSCIHLTNAEFYNRPYLIETDSTLIVKQIFFLIRRFQSLKNASLTIC